MRQLTRRLPDILYIWFVASLILPNVILSYTEPLTLWGRIANVALPLGVLGVVATASPKVGRTVWLLFPLVIIAAFQIVLLGMYGGSVIAVDMFLNVVTTNPGEAGELLSSLWPSVLLVCLLYLPSLVMAVYIMRRGMRLTPKFAGFNRRLSLGLGTVGLVAMMVSYAVSPTYAARRDIYPFNAGYNIYLAVDRTVRTGRYHYTSRGYSYGARSTRPDSLREVCVIVIGETSRASEWQLLGYRRSTNPRLIRRMSSGLYVAPRALSESNTTHKSVPMLLSPVESTSFDTDIYTTKSLITAFREAGWATAFVSNQRPNHSFIDFFGDEADETLFVSNQEGYVKEPGDFNLVAELERILAKGAVKQLIVLHSYGSHFDYRDRYVREDARYQPDDYPEAAARHRDALVNAYDNTIVATDRFLDSVIQILENQGCQASLLYASDHGEDIFDHGSGRFLHASPTPTIEQVHVPLIVWLSDGYRRNNPAIDRNLRANIRRDVSTSRSFCPTALALGGISTSKSDGKASLASSDYSPRPSLYLNDHNQAVSLKSILR